MTRNAGTDALLRLIVETLKLGARFQRQGDALTRDLGLTSSRWTFLGTVAVAERPLTVPDIARRMSLKPQTVQRFADAAVQDKFVTLEDNPDHKRARLVKLTAKGQRTLSLLEERERDWAATVLGKHSAAEIRRAAELLATIGGRIDELQ